MHMLSLKTSKRQKCQLMFRYQPYRYFVVVADCNNQRSVLHQKKERAHTQKKRWFIGVPAMHAELQILLSGVSPVLSATQLLHIASKKNGCNNELNEQQMIMIGQSKIIRYRCGFVNYRQLLSTDQGFNRRTVPFNLSAKLQHLPLVASGNLADHLWMISLLLS